MTTPAPLARSAPPSVAALFWGFLCLGLSAFGGALPLARRTIVEHRRWLTPDEFTELLGLCQFLPGGNVVNLSVAVGMRFHGVVGAVAALGGLIIGPTLVVIALGVVYERTQDDPRVQHMFEGLAAAAAGLLVAMACKMGAALRGRRAGIAVAALAFVMIAVLRVPLVPAMLALMAVSLWCAWRGWR
ncbi:MAG: chromate transporter [Rhodocyclaceae bacterium]